MPSHGNFIFVHVFIETQVSKIRGLVMDFSIGKVLGRFLPQSARAAKAGAGQAKVVEAIVKEVDPAVIKAEEAAKAIAKQQRARMDLAQQKWGKVTNNIDAISAKTSAVNEALEAVANGTHTPEQLAVLKEHGRLLRQYWNMLAENPRLTIHAQKYEALNKVEIPYSVDNIYQNLEKSTHKKLFESGSRHDLDARDDVKKQLDKAKELLKTVYGESSFKKALNNFQEHYYLPTPAYGKQSRWEYDRLVLNRFKTMNNLE